MARGRILHRLLQSLSDVPSERRRDAARRLLARTVEPVENGAGEGIIAEALALLVHPSCAALFAEGSRTEVPIVGHLADANGTAVPVSGQIDRLAITPDAVLIGDFKSERDVPKSVDRAPTAYIRQLALYRAVLQQLFPGRSVRAALIWTASAQVMQISEAMLDESLREALAERASAARAEA
jgi:ATP-dependent helicase/nuclease subunit A